MGAPIVRREGASLLDMDSDYLLVAEGFRKRSPPAWYRAAPKFVAGIGEFEGVERCGGDFTKVFLEPEAQ